MSREEEPIDLSRFMEGDKLKVWPAKKRFRNAALGYLASRFEPDTVYTESAVNDILNTHHTFGDPSTLRRELIDHSMLSRNPNGSQYWKEALIDEGTPLGNLSEDDGAINPVSSTNLDSKDK